MTDRSSKGPDMVIVDPEAQKRYAEREEFFTKVLRNFPALSGQIQDLMVNPQTGELPKEVELALNRLTEAGMWFRMAFDLERASRIGGIGLTNKGERPRGADARPN